ncbi:Rv0361 family membrane protein [Fodinicola feengrottensis]|uniref:Rv0361 family membrane protein n=1 Tax=Fodinicola feengrottensis TaxID=435914 RepID=UPI0013D2BA0B|nr:hypothetical protein [Fodinicola feengrottensis]
MASSPPGRATRQPSGPGYGGDQGSYGQQPGYGQPQPGYGQPQAGYGQPGFGDPNAGFPAPPPKKSNTGLILGIVGGGAALLLCCGGLVLVLFLTGVLGGGGGASSARDAADTFFTAIKNQDNSKATGILCDSLKSQYGSGGMPANPMSGSSGGSFTLTSFTYSISSDDPVSSTEHVGANVTLSASVSGTPQTVSGTWNLTVDNQSGGWKVCKFSDFKPTP